MCLESRTSSGLYYRNFYRYLHVSDTHLVDFGITPSLIASGLKSVFSDYS